MISWPVRRAPATTPAPSERAAATKGTAHLFSYMTTIATSAGVDHSRELLEIFGAHQPGAGARERSQVVEPPG